MSPINRVSKLAAVIILAVTGTAAAVILFECLPWFEPSPFVWRDVTLVYLACVTPLACVIARWLATRLTPALSTLMNAGLVCGIAALLAGIDLGESGPWIGSAIRTGLAFGLVLGMVMLVRTAVDWAGSRSVSVLALAGAAAIATLAPATYVHARCRHDLTELADNLQQSRLKEAQVLARRLLRLDNRLTLHGRNLPEIASRLNQATADLQGSVASPLPEDASVGARLERARRHAMLDETDSALQVLIAVQDNPEADNLRGTIHEARGEWHDGVDAYQRALFAWQAASPSTERTHGLARALAGVAYCQRKLGHYATAEASYRELLVLVPSADTHWLLAQFYEDAQHATLSRFHARKAISLAPDRYRQEGEKLIRKLSVHQFGCFAVFRAEIAVSRPTSHIGKSGSN